MNDFMRIICSPTVNALINSILGLLVGYFVAKFKSLKKKKDEAECRQEQTNAAILALLHDRIYELSETYISRSWLTVEEFDNLNFLYEPYVKLGGNGTGKALFLRVKKLPMRTFTDIKGDEERSIK